MCFKALPRMTELGLFSCLSGAVRKKKENFLVSSTFLLAFYVGSRINQTGTFARFVTLLLRAMLFHPFT